MATINGNLTVMGLETLKQTHTLIAGQTGSGKSVFINTVMDTLMLTKQPFGAKGTDKADQARLYLIDPKGVELSMYKHLPHTYMHAVSLQAIANAFADAEKLMDSRYNTLQSQGLRKWYGEDAYIIVDEFIEISCTKGVSKEEKELINRILGSVRRIATLGRAANVHMIIATQQPSITAAGMPSLVRANMDCTVCLKVKESKDSRMICGHTGAENFPRPKDVGYALCYFCTSDNERFMKFEQVDEDVLQEHIREWEKVNTRKPRRSLFGLLAATF